MAATGARGGSLSDVPEHLANQYGQHADDDDGDQDGSLENKFHFGSLGGEGCFGVFGLQWVNSVDDCAGHALVGLPARRVDCQGDDVGRMTEGTGIGFCSSAIPEIDRCSDEE